MKQETKKQTNCDFTKLVKRMLLRVNNCGMRKDKAKNVVCLSLYAYAVKFYNLYST